MSDVPNILANVLENLEVRIHILEQKAVNTDQIISKLLDFLIESKEKEVELLKRQVGEDEEEEDL